jgi:hypothetical protein
MVILTGWRYDESARVIVDVDGRTVAELAGAPSPDGTAEPAGALLAAAPDLRDALQSLVDALTNAEPDRNLTDQILIVEAIAKAGRALIKAERHD